MFVPWMHSKAGRTPAATMTSSAEKASNILIVGSGLVGLDAAYSFLEQGKHVTVVEMADLLVPLIA